MAWKWVVSQIRNNVGNEQWMHARSLTDIADISSRAFTVMGNCRFPLYITSEMAEKWFDVWRLINEQRMTQNEWSFLGSSAETNTLQPTLTFFRSVAQRNHARSRLRFLRARSLSPHLNLDVWDDEAHYVDPSGDESLPLERPEDPLNFPEYFFLSSPDPRLTVQSLKRRGDPLD